MKIASWFLFAIILLTVALAGCSSSSSNFKNGGDKVMIRNDTEKKGVVDCTADVTKSRWDTGRTSEKTVYHDTSLGSEFEIDFSKIELYISDGQKEKDGMYGRTLMGEFLGEQPLQSLNVNVLNHLLDNPSLIPRKWRGRIVHFWGTVLSDRNDKNLNVRFLVWENGTWRSGERYIDGAMWYVSDGAAAIIKEV